MIVLSAPLAANILLALAFGCDLTGKAESSCLIYGRDVGRGLINFGFGWSLLLLVLIPLPSLWILVGVVQYFAFRNRSR